MLWHAPGTSLPGDLVASLERRGVLISSCTSAYAAISWAALMERENDQRTDNPAERDSLVMVLVCPRALARPAEFIDAMERYAPRTACWWYDPRANPRLRAVVDADVDQWIDAGIRAGQPVVIRPHLAPPAPATTTPRLRLSGSDSVSSGPDEGTSGTDADTPHNRIEGHGGGHGEGHHGVGYGGI